MPGEVSACSGRGADPRKIGLASTYGEAVLPAILAVKVLTVRAAEDYIGRLGAPPLRRDDASAKPLTERSVHSIRLCRMWGFRRLRCLPETGFGNGSRAV